MSFGTHVWTGGVSLTTLRDKLLKIGAKVVRHGRYPAVTFSARWHDTGKILCQYQSGTGTEARPVPRADQTHCQLMENTEMRQALKTKIGSIILGSMIAFSVMAPKPAAAQAGEPFIGQLMLVGFTFCPRGWTNADGQLLAISQYSALFSLYGTTYGGDGRTTFALPDLRGRSVIHTGTGPGLPAYPQGARSGATERVLTTAQMPSHSHDVKVTNEFANKPGPGGKLLAADDTGINKYSDTANPPNRTMNTAMISNTGGNQPVDIRDPYLVMRWCVALVGIFPSRN